jgi:hypothetical protein
VALHHPDKRRVFREVYREILVLLGPSVHVPSSTIEGLYLNLSKVSSSIEVSNQCDALLVDVIEDLSDRFCRGVLITVARADEYTSSSF